MHKKNKKNSVFCSFVFPVELENALKEAAEQERRTYSWCVREACFLWLAARGVRVSIDNPAGQGSRSDLRRATDSELSDYARSLADSTAQKKRLPPAENSDK